MEKLQQIIDQIPIRHNIISYFISIGIFLGLLLSLVILFRTSKRNNAFRIYGWSLLIQSIIAGDVFLCYTGLIKYVPHLNDSTEPLVLLLAPSIYLFVYALLKREPITFRKHWIHVLLPIGYFISQLKFYFQSTSIKINAYLGAYFPDMERLQTLPDTDYDYLWIKDEFRWLILFSFITYIILSLRIVFRNVYKSTATSTGNIRVSKYDFSKNTLLGFLVAFILIFLVFLNFEDDGGDHYIFLFYTAIVCITGFVLLSESRFFENSWIADKYETSGFTATGISIEQIRDYVEKEKFYLSTSASLKNLSEVLKASPNYISQIINAKTGLNFNDFINQYRINLSKQRLINPNYNHLTIEAIGNSVGFKSKSSFYNAFKKHVEMSPKEFISFHNASIGS